MHLLSLSSKSCVYSLLAALFLLFAPEISQAIGIGVCQADMDGDGVGYGDAYCNGGGSQAATCKVGYTSVYVGFSGVCATLIAQHAENDNCPEFPNADQIDSDQDGVGDACAGGTGTTPQTITVTQPAPASAAYGSSFSVAATASSGLALSMAVTGGCTITGNTVTMSSGTTACKLFYAQFGDANYSPAASVTSITSALKASQNITITQPAPVRAVYGSSFTVAATASSGLTVALSGSGGCYLSGNNTLTMSSGVTFCSVTYQQAGNSNFNAASTVSNSTAPQRANQSITVTQAAPVSAVYGSAFTVTATASSGLPVSVVASGGCAIAGNTVTMMADNCTLEYTQIGNSNYIAASSLASMTLLEPFWLNGSYKGSAVSEVQTRQ